MLRPRAQTVSLETLQRRTCRTGRRQNRSSPALCGSAFVDAFPLRGTVAGLRFCVLRPPPLGNENRHQVTKMEKGAWSERQRPLKYRQLETDKKYSENKHAAALGMRSCNPKLTSVFLTTESTEPAMNRFVLLRAGF